MTRQARRQGEQVTPRLLATVSPGLSVSQVGDTPLVSLIVVTYNSASLLPELDRTAGWWRRSSNGDQS
jgi:hypothetical protein